MRVKSWKALSLALDDFYQLSGIWESENWEKGGHLNVSSSSPPSPESHSENSLSKSELATRCQVVDVSTWSSFKAPLESFVGCSRQNNLVNSACTGRGPLSTTWDCAPYLLPQPAVLYKLQAPLPPKGWTSPLQAADANPALDSFYKSYCGTESSPLLVPAQSPHLAFTILLVHFCTWTRGVQGMALGILKSVPPSQYSPNT